MVLDLQNKSNQFQENPFGKLSRQFKSRIANSTDIDVLQGEYDGIKRSPYMGEEGSLKLMFINHRIEFLKSSNIGRVTRIIQNKVDNVYFL